MSVLLFVLLHLCALLLRSSCDRVVLDLSEVSAAANFAPRRLASENTRQIFNNSLVQLDNSLRLFHDPPTNHSCPTALGVFVWSDRADMKIYWDDSSTANNLVLPTFDSLFADASRPYIQIDTPFKAKRSRWLTLVGVVEDKDGNKFRSELVSVPYFVEAAARPYSYGYMIPGIESSGYFVQIGLEMVASARAQAADSQEFADFVTYLGLGTYGTQIQALNLLNIDEDLNGFEGGFPYNITVNGVEKHYGLLIPYHNGNDFYGKVVRIDLQEMSNASRCEKSFVIETMLPNGTIAFAKSSAVSDIATACVHVIDLASKTPRARGFRRGFLGFPYGYLSPGEDTVVARLDLEHFGLAQARTIDLGLLSNTYGGFSGGFSDGTIACFNPFRTFSGVVGGIRSKLDVDRDNLRPYYNSIMVCVNESAWQWTSSHPLSALAATVRVLDFATIEDNLRGFSDALRVGRYAYLSPLASSDTVFNSKLIRISLGVNNLFETLDATMAVNGNIRRITNILDLSKVAPELKGFSGMYTAGRYLILVPYRNSYEPRNGQRGHGNLVRLNMNDFSIASVEHMDLTATTRNQIPSFADANLRGFSYGFASGQYGLLVPFFNADFDGKVARFLTHGDLRANLQELDLMIDRTRRNVYKGFRGGFASLWQGVES